MENWPNTMYCEWAWLTSAPDTSGLSVVAVVHVRRIALKVGQVQFRSVRYIAHCPIMIGPVPLPNCKALTATAPCPRNPSCLHTTWASGAPQRSLQMVPHSPCTYTSTRPSLEELPPTNRIGGALCRKAMRGK